MIDFLVNTPNIYNIIPNPANIFNSIAFTFEDLNTGSIKISIKFFERPNEKLGELAEYNINIQITVQITIEIPRTFRKLIWTFFGLSIETYKFIIPAVLKNEYPRRKRIL